MEEKSKIQFIAARDEYLQALREDILGPGSEMDLPDQEHEIISGSPAERYSAGILYPQGNKINLENDDTKPEEVYQGESTDSQTVPTDNTELSSDSAAQPSSGATYATDPEDSIDEDINISAQYMPSSMGITFFCDRDVSELKGKLEFATYKTIKNFSDVMIKYVPVDSNFSLPTAFAKKLAYDQNTGIIELKDKFESKDVHDLSNKSNFSSIDEKRNFLRAMYHLARLYQNGYKRIPHNYEFTVNFDKSGKYESTSKIDDVDAKLSAKKTLLSSGNCSITIMFSNNINGRVSGENCIFQSKIKISSLENDFNFVNQSDLEYSSEDENSEDLSLALLYRNKKVYGSGLGVSVDWNIIGNGEGEIWTEYIPTKEVPSMDFNLKESDSLKREDLSMKFFSDLDPHPRADKIAILKSLVDSYSKWISALTTEATKLDQKYSHAAKLNIKKCEAARDRMLVGISELEQDQDIYDAFTLANRAMFMQRIHTKHRFECAKKYSCLPEDHEFCRSIREIDYQTQSDEDCYWRPFQIAFLLMNIDSIVSDSSPNRNLIDLIWFPTGGGKTEAYLGLTALTIFFRRLKHLESSSGTAVIMRYTLRLLTTQQFERAATLICACEQIRKKSKNYHLGQEPITIGLWIGSDHAPNKNAEAKKYLDELSRATSSTIDSIKERYCKFQLLSCPWCGCKMNKETKEGMLRGKWGYTYRNGSFGFACPNLSCDFAESLPAQIVDEELYKKPPTLLFGTVDKFTMMTWDEKTGSFFATNSKQRAPELIIQDELHLISGSLGTIIGEYEIAIDALCSQKGVKPKIIASTATIRRAEEQCSNLYNRDVVQFPAPGLDSSDSFFAKEKPIDYSKGSYGRKYIGILPSGKTRAMIEIRVMASLAERLFELDYPDDVIDKFYTITAYFNSLRDLGKAATLIGDDVRSYIGRIVDRTLIKRRYINRADELTSRVATTKLNETLEQLEKATYNNNAKKYPVSMLLATNMISVGIDVPRLNTMLIVGQPKLTSEYIQATSRVGREYPGMVIDLYDTTRSRDRSHYEHFIAYHDSFYKYVEPTSVTPFAAQARDRALHAAIVALFRQQPTGIEKENDAAGFSLDQYGEVVDQIKQFILDRIKSINNRGLSSTFVNTEEVSKEIDNFFIYWDEKARFCRDNEVVLRYGKSTMIQGTKTDGCEFLLKAYNSNNHISAISTLTSMRNVDSPVAGTVVTWEELKEDNNE